MQMVSVSLSLLVRCLLAAALVTLAGAVLPVMAATQFDLAQRLSCHIALEEVRWQRRSWPESNSQPRPERVEVLPDRLILSRMERSLQMEHALRELYGVNIDIEAVQAEIERMFRASQAPEALAEMIEALGHDPQQVAECLARPMLIERRLRNAFARDRRWHGELLASIRAEIGPDLDLRETDSHFILDVTGDSGEPQPERAWSKQSFDSWWDHTAVQWPITDRPLQGEFRLSVGLLGQRGSSDPGAWMLSDHPEGRFRHTAVWTGSEMIVWGGQAGSFLDSGARYEPATDSWTGISRRGAPIPRAGHAAVWTGDRMVVWGGTNGTRLNSGGRYDPATDTWTSTSLIDAPQQRETPTAVWTGSEMIIWGGSFNGSLGTGGRYDPVANRWTPVTLVDAPEARTSHTALWTGEEMLIWGGDASSSVRLGNGGRYDPLTDSWLPINEIGAPSPRTQHGAVWTGDEMLVWGGWSGTALNTGGRYDPLSDSWVDITTSEAPTARYAHATVWTGQAMVVWSGIGGGITGARYEPVSDSWLPTSTVSTPEQASAQSVVWTGSEMIIWGGFGYLDSGGRYNPMLDQWVATGGSGAPGKRSNFASLWTGNELLIWGGSDGNLRYNDGGAWEAATDSWWALPAVSELSGRAYVTAVWTGSELIVWGGQTGISTWAADGARLDLVSGQWALLPETGGPEARFLHTAVWSGDEMIVWGGRAADFLGDGARYSPSSDAWLPVSDQFAADPRESHTAIWTGTEMVVWGGWRNAVLDTGGRYDPGADSWLPVALSGAPAARRNHTAIWTGSEMIIWGGGTSLFTGGRYDPDSNSWTATSTSGAPLGRGQHSAVWTGEEMIVWGGYRTSAMNSGGRYSPAVNAWTATTLQGAPAARYRHAAAWTGETMLIWGGCCTLNSLGRYLPVSPPEPPLVVISGLSPSPSLIDDSVTIIVEVSDPILGTWPTDGQVLIQASSGEFCLDVSPPGISGGVATFACSIDFDTPGQRELVAFFSDSQDFDAGDSSLQQVVHQVLTEFTYTVGGQVDGLVGSGLMLVNNSDDPLQIVADGPFQFPLALPDGSLYAVSVLAQPEDPAQFCQVIDGEGVIVASDVDDIVVQCSSAFFSVGGQVVGLEGSGLSIRINNDEILEIEADGDFVFPTLLPNGASYVVAVHNQPGQPIQSCGINGSSGTIDGADVDNVLVTCITNSYTIGGTVSGLLGEGLLLQNNGGDDLLIQADGSFTFATPLIDGSLYAVGVADQPSNPAQECSVSLGSGVINGANVTGVQINCLLTGFTVTPVPSAGGSINPDQPQFIDTGESTSFELQADADHVLVEVQGSCGGTLLDSVFTTEPVMADCTVAPRFARLTSTSLQVAPSPAGIDETVLMSISVNGALAAPAGGEVLVSASSGESCLADDPVISGNALIFECSISFGNPGERNLVAVYSGSQEDAPSESGARLLRVGRLVDVTVSLEALQSEADAGEVVEWLLEVRNLGPETASSVDLFLQMNPQVESISWVCLAIDGGECSEDHGEGDLPTGLALPVGAGLDFVISTRLPDLLPAWVSAQVDADIDEDAPHHLIELVPENNTAQDQIAVDLIFRDRFQL